MLLRILQDISPVFLVIALSYVMAREMDGDPELAAATVTASTVLSSAGYTFWIALLGRPG